ncbi:hypothetical protein [Microbacterium sp.]|uniref:hypothetical protein n=1 Tax=Microbacterium sp. TaxID=51671 RepID=UPI0025F82285|nr:hypothetical protein [Microbacterium sp.]
MQFGGVLPEDAPDPRFEREQQLQRMPIPVFEFAHQRSVGVTDIGVSSGTDERGMNMMSVSVSATLWRNPDDKSDPVNLADLDDQTRRSLEEVPPWPRPTWLLEYVERMRYPTLWDAVRTWWHRDESEYTTLPYLLVHHANHILVNRFRDQLGLGLHVWDSPALTSERVVRHGVDVIVDDLPVIGAEIDTDPFVYAIGANLPSGGTLTAVISREHVEYVDLKFARRKAS